MKKCMQKCCHGSKLAWLLVMIGGINWGLTGIGILAGNEKWNLVHLIFGNVGANVAWLEAVIYLLVGLATIALIATSCCKKCDKDACSSDACCDGADKHCCGSSDDMMMEDTSEEPTGEMGSSEDRM
jgi:uncharacterized membrane protein YuzA (DUF378 family)